MTRDEVIKVFKENGFEIENNRFYLEGDYCLQKISFAEDCISIRTSITAFGITKAIIKYENIDVISTGNNWIDILTTAGEEFEINNFYVKD